MAKRQTRQAKRCTALRTNGTACGNYAIVGGAVCTIHGGKAGQVVQKALVRAELDAWGLTDETVDPGVTLLRLVAQSARRAERYAVLLEADYEDRGVAALVGSSYTEHGKSGEYIKGLSLLEAQERDRCANFAAKALAAGIAERSVRLAEQLGGQLVTFTRGLLIALGLDPDDPQVREVTGQQMRALTA